MAFHKVTLSWLDRKDRSNSCGAAVRLARRDADTDADGTVGGVVLDVLAVAASLSLPSSGSVIGWVEYVLVSTRVAGETATGGALDSTGTWLCECMGVIKSSTVDSRCMGRSSSGSSSISRLHSGHVCFALSQGSMQVAWKTCCDR